ncbi:MAG TPA: ASKHA domain-containing protein, partial [Mobilitalea sp.]|nr:ASKHA domain-containing protein [Mobilitalea sp.]
EGGNLSCGVGSIPGAISHVSILDDKVAYQTIGDRSPIGICGTGIVDLAAELLKSKWMDETGLLDDGYFETGFVITDIPYDNKVESNESGQIIVTQKDIRELQLAKSAVRAGVEILIRRYGTSYDQIKTVYLAGGFGYKMNIEKAISIGLLPKELEGKIIAVGNSSLAGAVEYLMKEDAAIRMEQIRAASEEIHLSNDEDFNDLYIRYMNF